MAIVAIACLVAGVFCGLHVFPADWAVWLSAHSEWVLWVLMFSVGISVGGNKQVFGKVREYHVKILIIPTGVIVASALSGAVCAWILRYPMGLSLAIATGMGWYSLSGVMLTDLAGAHAGAVAFLSNLMREIFSFLFIPTLAKKFNYYTCIASAGATSEDTTLPMMVKYTSEDVVVMSVFSGFLCSCAVPVLIRFFYAVF